MKTTLHKVGGSKMIIIPSFVLKELGVKEDSVLNMSFDEDKIVITKVKKGEKDEE